MKTFLNNSIVRGLRNNNPGNLIRTKIAWQGKVSFLNSKDEKFEQFETLEYGILAQLKDLIHDINKGKNTVRQLISEYAPSSENNTRSYIAAVCKTINVQPDTKLTNINEQFLLQLARSIYNVELGQYSRLVTDDDIKGAIYKLGNLSTSLLTVKIDPNFFF